MSVSVQIIDTSYGSSDHDQVAGPKPGCGAHSRIARILYMCVDRYANFIGSIGGIVLSLLLLGIWLGLGKLMGYNDSNWWLIIGTYTGLVRLELLLCCAVLACAVLACAVLACAVSC